MREDMWMSTFTDSYYTYIKNEDMKPKKKKPKYKCNNKRQKREKNKKVNYG